MTIQSPSLHLTDCWPSGVTPTSYHQAWLTTNPKVLQSMDPGLRMVPCEWVAPALGHPSDACVNRISKPESDPQPSRRRNGENEVTNPSRSRISSNINDCTRPAIARVDTLPSNDPAAGKDTESACSTHQGQDEDEEKESLDGLVQDDVIIA